MSYQLSVMNLHANVMGKTWSFVVEDGWGGG